MTFTPRKRGNRRPETDLEKLANREIAGESFPGLVLLVEREGRRVCSLVRGHRLASPYTEAMTADTIFDLASLTKPLATALLVLNLADRGEIRLDSGLDSFFPGLKSALGRVTVRQLLVHAGGLAPDPELKRAFPGGRDVDRGKAADLLLSLVPGNEPGTRVVYSCSGYLILGLLLERVTGTRIGTLFADLVAGPAGIPDLFFTPPESLLPRIAPTERCAWRGRTLRGEVHDENAFCLGGEAGNAGLFGTADAVMSLLSLFGAGGRLGNARLLSAGGLALMTRCQTDGKGERRSAGFLMQGGDSPAGPLYGSGSFGHTGFTGTSVWCEPEKGLKVVCLTSRLQLGREATAGKIRRFRRDLHTAVYRAFA